MNDFCHLNYEYQTLTNHFTNTIETLDILKCYYEGIMKVAQDFQISISKVIDDRQKRESKLKPNRSSEVWLKIENIFELEKKANEQLSVWITSFHDNFIGKIRKYQETLDNQCNCNLEEFKNLARDIKGLHDKLDQTKHKYWKESENLYVIINQDNAKNDKKDTESEKNHDIIFNRQVEKTAVLSQQYKGLIEQTNALYEECQFHYYKIYIKNLDLESKTLVFIKDFFTKSNGLYDSLLTKLAIPNIFKTYIINHDVEQYKEEFQFTQEAKRIPDETFCTYDQRNNNIINNIESEPDPETIDMNSFINVIASGAGESYFSSYDCQMVELYSKPSNEGVLITNYITMIEPFIADIIKREQISFEALQVVKEQCSNLLFVSTFIEKYCSTYKRIGYEFFNMENLNIFGRLLMQMINSLDLSEIKSHIILSSIIKISEWSHCSKIFLCSILGKNSFFKGKSTWKKMIEYRILIKLQSKINEILAVAVKNSPNNSKGFFGLFHKSPSINNEPDQTLISEFGLNAQLEKYNLLTCLQRNELSDSFDNIVQKVLKEFIETLCNFNFDLHDSIQMIFEFLSIYSFSTDRMKMYKTLFNIASYTVRKYGPNEHLSSKTELKINDIVNRRDTIILIKFPATACTNNQKIILLWEISHFLSLNDKRALLFLNKEISAKIKQRVYTQLLLQSPKEIANKYRLDIWYTILKINQLKKKIDYDSNVQKAVLVNSNDCRTIELDVSRTRFPYDIQGNHDKAVRILKCMIYVKPEIKYYQGMNYIAAFFLLVTENEKEAFYLILGILEQTEFGVMFNQDFHRIRVLLLVFEKLLLLNFPSLFYRFKEFSVNTSCYITPFVVTLFTNVIQFMKEKTISDVLYNIWDDFMLNGEKALMKSLLNLLSYHNEIIETKNEESMIFLLINELSKSKCFHENHYEKWIQKKNQIRVTTKLIKSIEEEIYYEHLIE